MDEKTKQEQAAIDAVHAATTGSGEQQPSPDETLTGKKRSPFLAIVNRLRRLPTMAWLARCKLRQAQKARLAAFAKSNVGIVTLTLLVVIIVIAFSVMLRHHHQGNHVASNAWDKPTTRVGGQPVPTHSRTKPLVAHQLTQPVVNTASPTQHSAALADVMDKLSALTVKLNNIEQRLMVVTTLLEKKQHTHSTRQHYRVLGTRLDQDTNQYVADIEYRGQVKAYYAGQRLGHWVVRRVTATGASIR